MYPQEIDPSRLTVLTTLDRHRLARCYSSFSTNFLGGETRAFVSDSASILLSPFHTLWFKYAIPARGRLSRINLGDPKRDEKPHGLIEYPSVLFLHPLFNPCLLFTSGLINLISVFNRVNNCRYMRQSLLPQCFSRNCFQIGIFFICASYIIFVKFLWMIKKLMRKLYIFSRNHNSSNYWNYLMCSM